MAALSHVTKSISAKKFFISLRIFGENCNFYHCSLKHLGKYTFMLTVRTILLLMQKIAPENLEIFFVFVKTC
jgi:hypothetical protein